MADTVRNIMEGMIPELQDLEARGYFSKQEIREIMKKRSDFEYLLKRKAPRKNDYLRYVEYESNLEELRRLRKGKLATEGKHSLADKALVRRVHFIFERATRKFSGDLRLWLAWLDFCQAHSSKRMFSRVATKALRLLPNEAGLWAHVAAWHYEHQLDADVARSLMQLGLRNCPSSEDLWLDYVRFELSFAHKLHARRRVRGIPLPGESEGEGEAAGELPAPEKAMRAVMDGELAMLAFQGAVEALPGSLSLHRKTLDALRPLGRGFPAATRLVEAVYDSLAVNFPTSEDAWDLRARRLVEEEGPEAGPSSSEADASNVETDPSILEAALSCVEAACQLYDEALTAAPTQEMYERYSSFLLEHVVRLFATGSAGRIGQRGLLICSKAADAGVASPELFETWMRLADLLEQPSLADKASELACAQHQNNVHLHKLRAVVLVRKLSQSHGEAEQRTRLSSLREFVAGASRQFTQQELPQIWEVLVNHEGLPAEFCANLLVPTLLGLPKGPLRGGMGEVAGKVLRAVFDSQGAEAAKQLLWKLLTCPSPGGSLYHAALELDSSQPGFLTDAERCRVLEAGVDTFGEEDEELWLEYYRFDLEKHRRSGVVYRRAISRLIDPTSFMLKCQ
eukprot:jgi/Botrbrau1/5907/Bobra.0366s0084.2